MAAFARSTTFSDFCVIHKNRMSDSIDRFTKYVNVDDVYAVRLFGSLDLTAYKCTIVT